ncbi:PH, RCC1 and FYVE domains-containing protein 1-like [Aristolochia californica]|uniref:PH, RCC1 and FYVE domains-containing protein 1-like n=1 Tax=Aristolochia californica TaxID=171875 RepID=UPI0035D9D35A
MADLGNYGNPERDIEQAILALKKGSQLVKYSRKGKPKFCPFRVSVDGTTLIWYSHGHERSLKLDIVSKIISGQRTAVFRKNLRPDKEYLSFSLVYSNGERSLDLICKDKVETEVWFAGLKALIGTGQRRRSRLDSFDDGGDLISDGRPFGAALEPTSSISRSSSTTAFFDFVSRDSSLGGARSDVGLERANMQLRQSNADGVRLSVSSAPSCSSHSSGQDDIESLGDVYVWGAVWCDVTLSDGSVTSFSSKTDVLLPKPLESNVVLDVHQIACGVRHASLVTRQGEVFTWGEESGGRLGHGAEVDISRPQLVESLAVHNMDFIACGEYHTCAVSVAGDLFSWGDGTFYAGLLGNGTDISHWIPKRICGPLEGLQVLSVSCGTWHSALATSNGKLFTFGDGTFGALGHGDCKSVAYPREVVCVSELKTIKVACGVYHTAAIIEVTVQAGVHMLSRKLFTWGDGDKYRLGHGDKEPRLVPTCVSSLIDYTFHQLACGNSITVALTSSGHVFTMGSPIHGQLGNPQSDGKVPCLVQDKLVGELIEEISCGAFHVAVLTSRSEVFTWGNGANGRLGHGDVEDRKTPTLVEALKDRHVKSISCGSNFTASICIHKWVSGADQSLCSGCRQAFGFTRKRHNCYNCGLVHCHACSSKKALKAALAPTPGKPHRVCDSCYVKLKAAESGVSYPANRKNIIPRRSIDTREKLDRGEMRFSRILLSPNTEPVTYVEVKSVKQGMKSESISIMRASQVPSLLQLKDIAFPSSLSALQTALKPIVTSTQQPVLNSRPASPYSRRPSPPRSATPVFSRSIIDSLKKTNELLNQEVLKLQAQVKGLKQKYDLQDAELQRLERKAQEAASLATEESSACVAAKELIRNVAIQLQDVTEKLSPDVYDTNDLKETHSQIEAYLKANGNHKLQHPSSTVESSDELVNVGGSHTQEERIDDSIDGAGIDEGSLNNKENVSDPKENIANLSPKSSTLKSSTQGQVQVIEQFEPGVYVTLVQLRNGTRVFKRVRFSKRRFDEHQAEDWWKENKQRVFKKYNYRGHDGGPSSAEAGNDAGSSGTVPGNDGGQDGASVENDSSLGVLGPNQEEEGGTSSDT